MHQILLSRYFREELKQRTSWEGSVLEGRTESSMVTEPRREKEVDKHKGLGMIKYGDWRKERNQGWCLGLCLNNRAISGAFIASRAWSRGSGVGVRHAQPEAPKNRSWRWSSGGYWIGRQQWLQACVRCLERQQRGADWKGIGPRNLQTLQGEGGASKRLGQSSSLLPHFAQGCISGWSPSPGKAGRSVGHGVGAVLGPPSFTTCSVPHWPVRKAPS